MQKTKKILVPIDFSPCSENALAYAIQFAHTIDATIQLINITTVDIRYAENPYVAESVVEGSIKSAKQLLKKSLTSVKNNLSSFSGEFPKIETIVEIGSASALISEIAEQNQSDYIIMGTQGEHSKSYRLFGSTAATVVESAPCPLIIIPVAALFQSSIIMGYATNLTNSDPYEIWKATKLIKPIHIKAINCIHLSETHKNIKDKFDEFKTFFSEEIPDSNINFYNVRTEDKVEDLNNFIVKHKINLMVMYRPSRSFWKSLFGKSFTKEMSIQTKIPLLILKEE